MSLRNLSRARLLPPVKITQKANSIRVRSTSLINSLLVPRQLCRRYLRSRCRLSRRTPHILRTLPGHLQEYCNSPLQRRLFRTVPLRRDSALHRHTPTGQWHKLTSTGGKPTSHAAWLAFLALRDAESNKQQHSNTHIAILNFTIAMLQFSQQPLS